jgi:hypothetical protein
MMPFSLRTFAPPRILERMHIDTVGELSVTAQGGARYFVTMVYDFFSYCTIFLVHSKSQIRHIAVSKLSGWER